MSDRSMSSDVETANDDLGEILRTVVYAILIAFVFRTVLFQPFSIPSGSMKPTLLINDYLFVSKYAYGYSKFSVPLGSRLPDSLFGGRIFFAEPKRGDVIVFVNRKEDHVDYIKRLVGLPGDTVQMRSGVLYINGEPAKQTPTGSFVEPRDKHNSGHCLRRSSLSFARADKATRNAVLRDRAEQFCYKLQFTETLPGGVQHPVLDANGAASVLDNTRAVTVPPGHYFFVGDNRDNSLDSRDLISGVGFVPRQDLVGRAEMILLSAEGDSILKFWNWRSDRFFKSIN